MAKLTQAKHQVGLSRQITEPISRWQGPKIFWITYEHKVEVETFGPLLFMSVSGRGSSIL